MCLLTVKDMEKHLKNLHELNEMHQTKNALLEYHRGLADDKKTLISEITTDIATLEDKILEKSQKLKITEKSIQESLSAISDKVIVTAARLHYISGLTWGEIAYELHLGSEKNIKERFYRHYKKCRIGTKEDENV